MKHLILIFSVLILFAPDCFAHGGRTDSCGGHNNRKTGGYHVHNYTKYNACYPKETSKSTKSKKSLTCEEKIDAVCNKVLKVCLGVCENNNCKKACREANASCK